MKPPLVQVPYSESLMHGVGLATKAQPENLELLELYLELLKVAVRQKAA